MTGWLRISFGVFCALGALAGLSGNAAGQQACAAPKPVCAARDAVFTISSFDPFASAVRIAPDLLVTNRHVVADTQSVKLKLKDGSEITAKVVPSAYRGDLALLKAEGLGAGPVLSPEITDFKGALYTVAGDLARRAVRIYPPGRLVLKPAANTPFARLHHSAYSQPGNSGGALVNAKGALVAIVAAGGSGRYDAVPAGEVARLRAEIGPEYKRQARLLGQALRLCVEQLNNLPANLRSLRERAAQALAEICVQSANRPLFDRAAQALARSGRLGLALELSNKAVSRDPNSVNSRLTLVSTLFLSRRYKDTLPHIRVLIGQAPEDTMVQRFAVQAGKWGGDMTLAARGLALVRKHNPAQADAAQRFMKANIPPPPTRAR